MSQSNRLELVRIESIFHPSDFSDASEVAFAHALKAALITKADLNLFHVSEDGTTEWTDFPHVHETLVCWGVIPEGSDRRAVGDLGIHVRKAMARNKDPVKGCLDYLGRHPTDLIVLAVHQKGGWLQRSVGEPVAENAGQMTLFIPHGVDGFVSRQDGSVSLKNILIPIAHKPRPQPSIEAASRIIRNLQLPAGTITLLHAGSEGDTPAVNIPKDIDWTWNRVAKESNPVDLILHVASEVKADLVVMTTDGPEGFLDGLRGTTSQRVLHKIHCPVLNLPVGSLLS